MSERAAPSAGARADAWNPQQYERFRAEREQPFWDLLALVRQEHMRHAVDLGCGTGQLTAALHDSLQPEETLGIDSSPAMLARAVELQRPGLRFERGDIETWSPPEPVDLLFSNAALHWADDHMALFPRLCAHIAPRGQLAVQMPANFDHPSHTIAAALAAEEPFAGALGGYVRRPPVLRPEEYATLLHGIGFTQQIVRLQVYAHVLESAAAVVEWTRGTLLTDYQSRMPERLFTRFLDEYRARLTAALDDARPYFYPFKRLLIWASGRAAA